MEGDVSGIVPTAVFSHGTVVARATLGSARTFQVRAERTWLEMLVNVFQAQTLGEHQDLQVVEQLGDFLGRGFI